MTPLVNVGIVVAMANIYVDHYTADRPQSEQDKPEQVLNSADGYSFALDQWGRLSRFLILGSEGGSYYATERTLTLDNCKTLEQCIKDDGVRTVDAIVAISVAGRAPKQGSLLFALAVCMARGNEVTRLMAYRAMDKVCRTGSHLLELTKALKAMRGFGAGTRRAYARWYNGRTVDELAYQLTKYQQRSGMSHRDVLRMARVRPVDAAHDAVLRWAVKGGEGAEVWGGVSPGTGEGEAARLITERRLTHEMVPSELLGSPRIWAALLPHMPLGAMVRNLGRMTANGLLVSLSDAVNTVSEALGDAARLKGSRLHPLQLLMALRTYVSGHGVRGALRWSPVETVADALEKAFYASFGLLEATGQRHLLALDVSSSMTGGEIHGMAGITPRVGSAAMAMVTCRTEPQWHCVGFTHGLQELGISASMSLDTVLETVNRLPFGGTDCALPMLYALKCGLSVDVFVVYTDSETWFGDVHPHVALARYRKETGIPAKLIVVGMVANEFTIANPNDPGMLDIVGFDTAAPALMADFTIDNVV